MATKKKDTIPDEEMLLEQQAIAEEQPLSQTDFTPLPDEAPSAEESPLAPDEALALQTDSENTDSERIPAEDAVDATDSVADSQTETTTPEKPDEGPAPVRRTRKTHGKKSESDAEPEKATEHASDSVEGEAKTRRRRAAPRPASAVVAIDDRLGVETEADKARNDLLDLVESLKTKRILTGTIQGVERPADNPSRSLAVIYHGDYKIIIPAEEAVEPPSDFRGRLPEDVLHYMVTKRLGAEIDFIVKGIDGQAGLAVGSRLEAMAAKRREYYFGSDRDGNNLLYEGICAEARVVSVIRAGIFVDLFGLEVYIPLRELSYQRMLDASSAFQPGQRILVKILSIDRSDRAHPKVSASIKQAGENPYEKALRRYTVGNRYVGTVSMVDMNGVFVALDGGIDCLCSYPKRGRPPRGARVTVRILGINNDSNRIWGAITHIATPR